MGNPGQDPKDVSLGRLGREILDSGNLYDLLITKISDVAVDRIESQQSRSRNRIAIFLTVLVAAMTGIATFGFNALQDSIMDRTVSEARRLAADAAREAAITAAAQAVPSAVRDAVQDQISEAQQAWTRLSQATELAALSRRIEEEKAFTEEEASLALDLLTRLSEEDSYESFQQFDSILERVIDAFQGANRDDLVMRLEPMYGDLMVAHLGIVTTMVESLGRMLVGFEVLPSELGSSRMRAEWETLHKRYDQYADAARRHRYPEYPYAFDLVLAMMEADPDTVIRARLNGLNELSEQEREVVTLVLTALGTGNWTADSASPRAMRAVERTASLLHDYAAKDNTKTLEQAISKIQYSEHVEDIGGSPPSRPDIEPLSDVVLQK